MTGLTLLMIFETGWPLIFLSIRLCKPVPHKGSRSVCAPDSRHWVLGKLSRDSQESRGPPTPPQVPATRLVDPNCVLVVESPLGKVRPVRHKDALDTYWQPDIGYRQDSAGDHR